MDKQTLSNYGWIVIAILVLVVMIALATPFGTYISDAVKSTTQGLFDVNQKAGAIVGLELPDQEFDKSDMNQGAGDSGNEEETPAGPETQEYKLSGTWLFNSTIDASASINEEINFTTSNYGESLKFIRIYTEKSYVDPMIGQVYRLEFDTETNNSRPSEYTTDMGWSPGGQIEIIFNSEQDVSEEFYNWFIANATQQ